MLRNFIITKFPDYLEMLKSEGATFCKGCNGSSITPTDSTICSVCDGTGIGVLE